MNGLPTRVVVWERGYFFAILLEINSSKEETEVKMEINVMEFVSNFGFPAFVAIYVLHKINHTLEKLTEAIYTLTIEVKTFAGEVKK